VTPASSCGRRRVKGVSVSPPLSVKVLTLKALLQVPLKTYKGLAFHNRDHFAQLSQSDIQIADAGKDAYDIYFVMGGAMEQ